MPLAIIASSAERVTANRCGIASWTMRSGAHSVEQKYRPRRNRQVFASLSERMTVPYSPDGASIVPWGRGRNIAWDVTVADTFAASYLSLTSVQAGAAAERAALLKTAKLNEGLARNHIFAPWACEVTGGLVVSGGRWRFFKSWWGGFRRWQVTNGRLRFCFRVFQLCCRGAMQHACWVHSQSQWTPFQTSAPPNSGLFFLFYYFTLILSFLYIPLAGPGV